MTRTQTSKNNSGFDFYSDKTMNHAELTKLIRDHGVTLKMLSKNDFASLLKSFF